MQPSHSPVEHDIVWLNLYLMAWLFIILFLVAGLLLYVMWRFSAKRHPIPTKTTHNAVIELIWTLGPVVFLIAKAVGSVVPTPGGIGGVEAAMTAGLAATGLPTATAARARSPRGASRSLPPLPLTIR